MMFPKFLPQFSALRLFPNLLLGLGLITFSPSEAIANSVEIRNYQSLGNKVTLKVKVFDRQNNFVEGLQKDDFTIETRDENGNTTELTSQNLNLIQPQNQRSREPAYVLFLVDISGSMAQKDSSGTEKLAGAVTAIQRFIQQAKTENFPIYVEIVPFGYTNGSNCFVKPKHQVNIDNIVSDYSFTAINDENIDNINEKLSELREISPCASTNLAKPLEAGAYFLKQKYQENENSRLMMVLLSDGFDNSSKNQIEKISQNLQTFPLTVHTLGYGESLVQLRNRAQGKKGGKCNISEQELNPQNLAKNCQLPVQNVATTYEKIKNYFSKTNNQTIEKAILKKFAEDKQFNCKLDKIGQALNKQKIIQLCSYPPDINEYIIDENFLKTIAATTGGDYQLSADVNAVADSLIKFLKSLREYELEYKQPKGDRATGHETIVKINSESRGLNNVISQPKYIRLAGFEIPSRKQIINIGMITLVISSSIVILFLGWNFYLKQKSIQDLRN